MLLEENGFVEKESSSPGSPRRNGSSSNGTAGRRRRPPPADFVPFDTSESTNVRRRNGGSVNSENKKSEILSLEKPVLMDWKDIPGLILRFPNIKSFIILQSVSQIFRLLL